MTDKKTKRNTKSSFIKFLPSNKITSSLPSSSSSSSHPSPNQESSQVNENIFKIRKKRTKKNVSRKETLTQIERKRKKVSINTEYFYKFGSKTSQSTRKNLDEGVDRFWNQLCKDLEAFSSHAGRDTIEVDDVKLLLKRQRFITDQTPFEDLIRNHLPMEFVEELDPLNDIVTELNPLNDIMT